MRNNKVFVMILLLIIILIISIFSIKKLTGNIILIEDQFPKTKTPHWTHMPVTYSISGECKNKTEYIQNAMNKIESSANNSVYFEDSQNPDINISCSYLENCYQNKKTRKWFWIITTETICAHESGTSQITSMRGNKILKAKINLAETEKLENCSETIIHEILHTFDFQHSENPESIMYPEKASSSCNEKIDGEIIKELIEKYNQ